MPERPNVLFLLSDEHSFRCLSRRSQNISEPTTTPTLDGLASNGTEFTDTYCQMPLCAPSRLCLLTGREAQAAGGWGNPAVLPPNLPTLPRTLSESDYRTCLVGKMHLGGNRQYVGFDERPYGDLTGDTGHQWEPLSREGGRSIGDRIADAGITELPESQLQEYITTRESLSWIREHDHASKDPWFLTASLSRPHFPLTAPRRYVERYWDDGPTSQLTAPKVGREGDSADHPMTNGAIKGFETGSLNDDDQQYARACYFAAVEFLDDVLGEFLGTLERDELLENTIIVYTSDHGELAGEHGLWWKHTWHEAATRVPLIIQTPAQRGEDRSRSDFSTPVSLADLFPTLCGFTNVEPPDNLDGTDLSDAIVTGREPNRGPIVCDNPTPRWGEGTEFRIVRDGCYKYIAFRDAPELFFDLEADPLEQHNLAADATEKDAAALKRLRRFVDRTMNFEKMATKRDDDDLSEQYPLVVDNWPVGSGNCYLINGHIIDADTLLYEPRIVAKHPADVFDDYPK